MRPASSRAGITTLTRSRGRRGRERRPAAAAAREPGQHDGGRARLGEAEQASRTQTAHSVLA